MIRYGCYFCYRNLVKPIAVQSKEKEDRYVDTYKVTKIPAFCLSYVQIWRLLKICNDKGIHSILFMELSSPVYYLFSDFFVWNL